MWSDPIDNALSHLQSLLDQRESGYPPTADQWDRAKRSLARARECREFEKLNDRLVNAGDQF